MTPLDPKTMERLAEIICDIGGAYERSGVDLERLLKRSGWARQPEYDGSARIPWLIEELEAQNASPAGVEQLLRRICSAVEYDDGAAGAELVRTEVNRVLAAEGLAITTGTGHPLLGAVSDNGQNVSFSAPDDLEDRLTRLISDRVTVDWLLARANEASISEKNGAYTLALIGIGSFVEHLLLSVLTERDPRYANGFTDHKGHTIPPERATLDLLIRTAHAGGWIQVDARDFIDKVRDYRNFVHLRRQSQSTLAPDADTVMLCWGPVTAVLNDLESFHGRMVSEETTA